jgi:MFS superfamily sulfate permease-like transporter
MFGAKHGYRLDATQEFLAIGVANLAAGLGSAFPISGGMSQSLVNETGGARTPLSGLVAALITLLIAVFFTGLLRDLPQPVLAAIILMAVTGLIQIETLKHIWRFSRTEFAVAMAALLGVLGSGLLNGVLLGVVFSLVLLLGRASRPRVTELGRVPGTTYFADIARHPENERIDDVLVLRTEGALLYFNVDHIRDRVSALLAARRTPMHLVVFFMGNVPHVDLAGVEFLFELDTKCRDSGVEFRLAEVHGPVRAALRRLGEGHGDRLAEANQTVADILSQWRDTSHTFPIGHTT